MTNQSIKCQVSSCKHNMQNSCDLKTIEVGNSVMEPTRREETECNSFEM
jgi:hypothetical protein